MLTFAIVWFAGWCLFFLFKWQGAKAKVREAEAGQAALMDNLRTVGAQQGKAVSEAEGLRRNAHQSAEALSKAFRRLEEAEVTRKREADAHAAEVTALRAVVARQGEALGEGREFMGEWLKRVEQSTGG